MRSDALGGRTIAEFGAALAPANLSARQAREKGLLTSGTYGPPSSTSSASADLTELLASRLRARLPGTTLYRETWKAKATPSGRRLWAHTASAHRTSDSGSTGWPTSRSADGEKNVRTLEGSLRENERKGGPQDLNSAAQLVGWPTPTRQDAIGSGARGYSTESGRHTGTTLTDAAFLAGHYVPEARSSTGWTTPSARDWKDSEGMAKTRPDGRSRVDQLGRQAFLTSAPTGSGGPYRLNPRFSLWLMGVPQTWVDAAPPSSKRRATRSSRNSRRRS